MPNDERAGRPPLGTLLDEALAQDTSPERFLTGLLPELHEHVRSEFDKWIVAPLAAGVRVGGASGGTWTVRVGDAGLDARVGRGADVPLLTLRVEEADWRGVKSFLEGFPQELEDVLQMRLPRPARPIDGTMLASLAALGAILDLVLEGIFEDGPARASILLGAWEEGVAPRVRLSMHADDVEDLLDGAVTPAELWREGRLHAEGDTAVLARIGTVLAPAFTGLLRT